MRELTVRIRYVKHCLGNVKQRDGSGRFELPRNPDGVIVFLASWHQTNLRYATQTLNRHQDVYTQIHWDINVDVALQRDRWYRRYYPGPGAKNRYVLHEAIYPGQVVGINCCLPSAISDEDFWRLMTWVGRYRGLSPYKPRDYGLFEVETIRARRSISGDGLGETVQLPPAESPVVSSAETETA